VQKDLGTRSHTKKTYRNAVPLQPWCSPVAMGGWGLALTNKAPSPPKLKHETL